jgi:hypothetical protein
MAMDRNDRKRESRSRQAESVSLDPLPSEEAVADLLKVKKPEQQAKPKKPRSRERRKRNVDPRGSA